MACSLKRQWDVRILLALVCFASATADAQVVPEARNFPAERFRLAVNREGLIDVEWGRVLPHLKWDLGLWVGFARSPLVLYREGDNRRVGTLVQDRLGAGVVATLGLFNWVELGFELPLTLYQRRPLQQADVNVDSEFSRLQVVGVGDLRVVPKFRLVQSVVDLGVLLGFTIPTGFQRDYLGEAGFTFSPELLFSKAWEHWRIAANLGVTIRNSAGFLNQRVSHEGIYRAGVGYRFDRPWEIDVSVAGTFSLPRPFSFNERTLELRGQVSYTFANKLLLFAGGGAGILRGWGTPDFRAFIGVRYGDTKETPKLAEWKPPPPPPPVPASVPTSLPASAPASAPVRPPVAPKALPTQVVVRESKLELLEPVYFERGKAIIKPRSYPILDNVADTLQAHPEIVLLRIEGHTDSQSSARLNRALSQRRAEAVKAYLVRQGVNAARLTPKGYGPDKPIASNRSAMGRAQNRRVEFVIVTTKDQK